MGVNFCYCLPGWNCLESSFTPLAIMDQRCPFPGGLLRCSIASHIMTPEIDLGDCIKNISAETREYCLCKVFLKSNIF